MKEYLQKEKEIKQSINNSVTFSDIGFFFNFYKVAPKSGQRPCTIVQGLWPNFIKND